MKEILQTRIEVPLFIYQFFRRVQTLIKTSLRFFCPPFSLPVATFLGFLVGVLSPYFLKFLDKNRFMSFPYDYNAVPLLPAISVVVMIILLLWQSRWHKFEWNWRCVLGATLGLALLIESAVLSYYGCRMNHICMGGHFEHPPYLREAYMTDFAWPFGLVTATLTLFRAGSPSSIFAASIAGFLISMRFVFGSFGGFYPFL